MKKIVLNLLLMSSLSVTAQTSPTSIFNEKNTKIKHIESSKSTGSSIAVVVDEVPLAHTIQFLPLNKDGKLVGNGNLKKQVNQIFDNIEVALEKVDAETDDIVKMNVYVAEADLVAKVQEQFKRKFSRVKGPAISFVVGNMIHPDALVAIDVVAASGLSADTKVKYFKSDKLFSGNEMAHVSILPPTGVVYVSGQADKGELAEATLGTLKQLEETLTYLGLKKEDVVQIKSFVYPATDFKIVEKQIAEFFKGLTVPPILYVDWISPNPVVEIELIAASSPKASKQLEFITPPWMTSSPVYSKVTRVNHGKKIYISSLYGEKAADAHAEVTDIYTSLKEILNKAGSDLNHLAKATYYVSNTNTSTKLNELRPKYYDPKRPPAASKATVKGVGLIGKGVAVDMIGIVVDK